MAARRTVTTRKEPVAHTRRGLVLLCQTLLAPEGPLPVAQGFQPWEGSGYASEPTYPCPSGAESDKVELRVGASAVALHVSMPALLPSAFAPYDPATVLLAAALPRLDSTA
jgi:hypothetical protein